MRTAAGEVDQVQDPDASVAAAAAAAGPVDVLVNNAAVSVAAPVEDTPADVALQLFDTNVVGPMRLIKAILPGMRERGGGTVVNVSSVAGKAGFPTNGLHAASKHALEALSEALAVEVAPFGIRVLVLQLGSVATDMYQTQPRYVCPPYAELNRGQQAGFAAHQSWRAAPEQVGQDRRRDRGRRQPAARAGRPGRRLAARRARPPGRHGLVRPRTRAARPRRGSERPVS
ncbi:MAG: SDR family NAD(P)-dependent oxidoreductase [Egibacteraceae bacterium]